MPNSRVQILEKEKSLLEDGLRKLFRIHMDGEKLPGAPLELHDGHPLIQDILERLGVIGPDSSIEREDFKEQVPSTFTLQQLHPRQWTASSTTFEMDMDDSGMNFEYNQFMASSMSFEEFSDDEKNAKIEQRPEVAG